jgi:putative oxidoreductase
MMHMILNTFPELLTYGILSPFILRVLLGIILINLGVLKLTSEKQSWEKLFETIKLSPAKIFVKIIAFIEVIGGAMLLLGAYTQITAIILSVLFFCEAILEYRESSIEKRNFTFYILMFSISLSLVFLGAGAFALDFPL